MLHIDSLHTFLIWIAVSPDGRWVAAPGDNATVRLWEIGSGKEPRTWQGPDDWRAWAVFSPDSKVLGVSSHDNLRLWNVETGKEMRVIKGVGKRFAFAPGGKQLAAIRDGTLRLLDVGTGHELGRFEGELDFAHQLAFSADGKRLAGLSYYDSEIRIWDVATGKRLLAWEGHVSHVACLAFSPDGKRLASGGARGDARLLVWDLATSKPVLQRADHHGAVCSVAWSSDGKILATGDGQFPYGTDDREAQIRLWRVADGRLVRQLNGHINSVFSLAFAPDGKTLLSAGGDARAALWDVTSGKRLHWLRGVEHPKTARFTSDGKKILVVGNWERELSVWQTSTGTKVLDIGGAPGRGDRPIPYAAWLPDRKTVGAMEKLPPVIWDREKDLNPPADFNRDRYEFRFWDADTGQKLHSFPLPNTDHGPGIQALSTDGKTLAVSEGNYNQSGVIHVLDTASGQRLLSLRGHAGAIEAMTFSPDGRTLASGSSDTTILLWDVGRARLQHLWLQSTMSATAEAKTLQRLGTPDKAVSILKEWLAKAAAMEGRVDQAIAELDDDNFEVREKATAALEELGEIASPALRKALQAKPSAEAHSRIQHILDSFKKAVEGEGHVPNRIMLYLALLEEIPTTEARKMLEDLAGAKTESRVRQEARTILERLPKIVKTERKFP